MMPEDGLEILQPYDAIFLGAVLASIPGSAPDHVLLWGLLIPIRRGFHQKVDDMRPAMFLPGDARSAARPRQLRPPRRARETRKASTPQIIGGIQSR